MQTGQLRSTPALLLILAGFGASGAAAADDPYSAYRTPHSDWSLFAGANFTDNATLAPNGPSDTIATAGFGGSLYRDTGHLTADLNGLGYYEDYLSGTYSSNWLGNFRGVASYAFVPETFSWAVEDYFGQVNINPLLPTTPANRINGNVFSTGPDGHLRFSSDLGLALGARYSQSNYQSNPSAQIDDQRLTGNVGLVKHLSPVTSLSLNVTGSRIEYRVPGHPGYDQVEFFGRFESRTARSGLALDAGTGKLKDSITGSTVQEPLLRLSLFHRLTPSWTVNLSAGQQYQNTSSALQSALSSTKVVNNQVTTPPVTGTTPWGTGGAGGTGSTPWGTGGAGGTPSAASGPTANVYPTQSPFLSKYLSLSFDFVAVRTSIDLHGRIERQRYQFGAQVPDRNLSGGGVRFGRQLQPSLSVHAGIDYEREASSEGLPGYRTTYGDVGVDWRVGALLTTTLAYHREDRSTDSGGFPYVVNRIYLGVAYGPPKRLGTVQPPTQAVPGTTTLGP